MTYRDHISDAMKDMAKEPRTVVVGYNSTAGGTCDCFNLERRFEMPLAENLMAGAAIGMSLDGLLPIVWFERADFLFCAMDAIVNHADKLADLSDGMHKPGIIFRVAVGNRFTPLYSGPTHTQDPMKGMIDLVSFRLTALRWKTSIGREYQQALADARAGRCTMLFEYRDMYQSD